MSILVTGASAGFGRAICRKLIGAGYRVIGAARRADKLAELRTELGENFLPLTMDVGDTASVDAALQGLPENFAQIDCLVNNAGLALGLDPAYQADFADWQTMIQTNVIGLSYLTRQVLPGMVARGKGYVINLGSVVGTYPYPGGNVYGATKAYVRQFSLNLRADLAGTGVRVSNIEPGLCGDTEFSNVRFKGDDQRAADLYANVGFIRPEDIADTVLWLYQRPAHMNVNSIEIMPAAQSFAALTVTRRPAEEKESP
ncbi:SDR family oxidoreductase [Eikenella sp. S3360]|uniref:SDR family oxidoreductase n=1 Tax=Eikenella glucosivorans TaxID=2766967 RepID=A0ABS0N9U5_9NEIS|nr:SDR family oxidoreductase [Eikenella glucosivorans]MBH5329057.1 SDR family oxidoreductase [Eikenella glucosivorans]